MIKSLFLFLLGMAALTAPAEDLFVNSKTGNDANPGTRAQPVKTLREAARRANMTPAASTTIILAEGVHLLTETVLFNNPKYTAENRLLIRAEIMPDDPAWTPQRMPMLVPVVPTLSTGDGEEARGLEIEASHVTIEGIRFTGSPDYYYIDGKQNRRSYPIWRQGKDLDDLLITQCLFTGNHDVLPLRVGVVANGHGLVIDHCVFFNCENPVVFGDAVGGISHHNAMRSCLVYGSNYSGVWTTKSTGQDFEFHHNIFANCRAAWISENSDTERRFKVHDCIFTGNTLFTADGRQTPIAAGFLETDNIRTAGTIELEKDQGRNNYLQLKEGSFGTDLTAGLFKK